MAVDSIPLGRRERNKLDKLARITKAAGELFEARGVDEVTTQEIAERADIGTGTLFLYAKSKGDLLLLVQNVMYADALEQGRVDALATESVLDGIMAVIRPVVECNRKQVDNGRTYLREIVFGDPEEPHHLQALTLTIQTEELISEVIGRHEGTTAEIARTLARVASAIVFISMAATINAKHTVDEVITDIQEQIQAILPPAVAPNRSS